jgi:hypothetical protein
MIMRLASAIFLGFIVASATGCHFSSSDCTADDDSCDCTANDTCPGSDGSGTAQELVDGSALLQSVSNDQSWMAYLQTPSQGAVTSGPLFVAPMANPAQAQMLAQNAYSASLSTDSRLFFLDDPQPSIDANSTATYGRLKFWMPGMAAAAPLSTGYAVVRETGPNNAYALFFDPATPSAAGFGDIKLARASDCTAGGCTTTTLVPAVRRIAGATTSSDGRFAAFTVFASNLHGYDTYLVDILAGTASRVVSGGSAVTINFSTDGALLAAVGPGGALRIFDSASHAPVTWSALPEQTSVVQVAFSDPTTLVVRAKASGATQADAWVTTPTASTQLATGINNLGIYRSAASGGRWAVLSHNYTSGVGDLVAYDLTGASALPITVASASGYSALGMSADGQYLRVLENYDATAGIGDLVVVSLPDGQPQAVASQIAVGAPAFFGGAHELGYLDGNGTFTVWNDTASTDLANGVVDWRARGSTVTLYFTVGDAGDSIFGYPSGIYTQPAP